MKNTTTQGYGVIGTGRIDIPIEMLAGGGTPPAPVTRAPYTGYGYTIDDDSYFQFPLPIDYEFGTERGERPMQVVIRWAVNEAFAVGSAQVRWRIHAYLAGQNRESIPDCRQVVDGTRDINIPTLALQVQETIIGEISADYIESGDEIGMLIERVAIESGTDPVQEPEIIECWVTYPRIFNWGVVSASA